eukprot:8393903-Pyramimonas_sp.AAC.1
MYNGRVGSNAIVYIPPAWFACSQGSPAAAGTAAQHVYGVRQSVTPMLDDNTQQLSSFMIEAVMDVLVKDLAELGSGPQTSATTRSTAAVKKDLSVLAKCRSSLKACDETTAKTFVAMLEADNQKVRQPEGEPEAAASDGALASSLLVAVKAEAEKKEKAEAEAQAEAAQAEAEAAEDAAARAPADGADEERGDMKKAADAEEAAVTPGGPGVNDDVPDEAEVHFHCDGTATPIDGQIPDEEQLDGPDASMSEATTAVAAEQQALDSNKEKDKGMEKGKGPQPETVVEPAVAAVGGGIGQEGEGPP